MDKDATWYGGRPRPRGFVVDREPAFPRPKQKGTAPTQFSAHVYSGWMDRDATWHGGRPRPSRRCVR